MQPFQRRTARHFEAFHIVVVAFQVYQRRILRDIKCCQLVITTVQNLQSCVLRDIKFCQLVRIILTPVTITFQFFKFRIVSYVQFCQRVDRTVKFFQLCKVLDALEAGNTLLTDSNLRDGISLRLREAAFIVDVLVEILTNVRAEGFVGEVCLVYSY